MTRTPPVSGIKTFASADDLGLERAWPGGPLRRVGSGNGSRSAYVCDGCLTSVAGVYRVQHREERRESWFCKACMKAYRRRMKVN